MRMSPCAALLVCLGMLVSASLVAADEVRQPDLAIRVAGSPWLGDDVLSLEGTGQTVAQSITPAGSVTYYLRLENDGDDADSFVLTGGSGSPVWPLAYYDDWAGGSDITAEVTGAGWVSRILGPGEHLNLRFVLGTTPYTPGGAVKQFMIRAASVSDPAARDAVRQISSLIVRTRADAQVRESGSLVWLGGDIYNITGAGQTGALTVPTGVAAVYYLRIQADGNVSDAMLITGDPAPAGWTVAYFDDLTGGNDITAAVTGAGWTSPAVTALLYQRLRVEVTPSGSVSALATRAIRVAARSVSQPMTPPDVVALVTSTP